MPNARGGYGRGGGSMSTSRGNGRNSTFGILRDEWIFVRILLPYLAMLFGMILVFVFASLTRLFIQFDARVLTDENQRWVDTWVVTGIVVFSGGLLGWLAWKFWGQRKAIIVKEHATITVACAHAWWIVALWENYGETYFSRYAIFTWLFGSAIIGLSWCLRNWAMSKADEDTANGVGGFDEIGLGPNTHLGRKIIDGDMITAEMKMGAGHTTEDAKKARGKIAALAGKPMAQVHIRDHKSGDFDKAEVVILKSNPFADPRKLKWRGPMSPGDSVVSPIEYATYEDSTRPVLHLAGHKGGSSQHYLVMGMSGTGKSKAWQAVYGTVLSRREVNVLYIDPAKGIQTAGPLLKGIDLFADTLAMGKDVIERVQTAIRERTDYLASRGLSHWESGCGINFLIVHIEEAARFARVKTLVELVEAARSAGIMLVFSLQRAEGSRLNTNTRYNLGGSMCFGTYGLRDAEFALSEYTRQAGAIPHHWQDRYPGRHYLEANGVDPRMFAMSVQVDWIDMAELKASVEEGTQFHTPMDEVTARALGDVYADYRRDFENGDTQWQQLEATGIWTPKAQPPTIEGGNKAPENEPVGISVTEAERILWEWLTMQSDNGVREMRFKDIVTAIEPLVLRKEAWINVKLGTLVRNGSLDKHPERGMYYMPVKRKREPDA